MCVTGKDCQLFSRLLAKGEALRTALDLSRGKIHALCYVSYGKVVKIPFVFLLEHVRVIQVTVALGGVAFIPAAAAAHVLLFAAVISAAATGVTVWAATFGHTASTAKVLFQKSCGRAGAPQKTAQHAAITDAA